MELLIADPFRDYQGCDKNTIKELVILLIPLCKNSSIISKGKEIIVEINKTPIIPKNVKKYISELRRNKELQEKITLDSKEQFIWQRTLTLLKPLFDKIRESTESIIIRGGNIMALDTIKSSIREKIKKIKPKKSID